MEPGQRVILDGIRCTRPGEIVRIEDINNDLPDLTATEGPPSVTVARHFLRELQVDRVAIIRYEFDGETFTFAAVHNFKGWQDLSGQHITITTDPEPAR